MKVQVLSEETKGMKHFKAVHRLVGIIAVIVLLYLSLTRVLIQSVDLSTIFSHAPAADPNMMAIREGMDGAGECQVITESDYAAQALAANVDIIGSPIRDLTRDHF